MNRFLVRLIMLVPIILVGLTACRQEKKEAAPPELPAEFQEFTRFYQRFHEDSLYQMEHIQFPLQGLPADVDSATLAADSFFWQESEWVMHRPLDAGDADFQRNFTPLSEDLIVEKIVHKTGQFGMMRRWARLAGEWYLIYYVAMNQLAPQEQEEESIIRIEGGES